MRKETFYNKFKNANIDERELKRKYDAYIREQEELRMIFEGARQSSSSSSSAAGGGGSGSVGYRIQIDWFYSYFMEGVPPEFYEPSFWTFIFTVGGDYNEGVEATGVTIEEELPGGVFRTTTTFNAQMVLPPLLFSLGKKPTTSIRSFIDLDGAVTELKYAVFANSDGLEEVILPAVTMTEYAALAYCDSLISVTLPKLIISQGLLFYQCGYLEEVNLPMVIELNDGDFYDCPALTSVNVPNLQVVGYSCFNGCSSLQNLFLPSAEIIRQNAFQFCPNLELVYAPQCTDLGGSVLNNDVFYAINPKPFTLTIDASRQTCNSGGPDGDIAALADAMTPLTVIYV